MPWLQLQYSVDRALAGPVGEALEECGAMAVSNENGGEDDFFEVAFPGEPDWQRVRVTGMFELQVDADFVQEYVLRRLAPGVNLDCSKTMLSDRDWERAWMDAFEPLLVGKNMWVCPAGQESPEPGATNILLDPGLAFGTGSHPTTAMCLDWISCTDVTGSTIVDYGCGSGILGIAAALRGAAQVYCVDIDPLAIQAATENAVRNGVARRLQAGLPAGLEDDLESDVVIVNILADVIVRLGDELTGLLREDGALLLTGILERQVQPVRARFEPGIRFEIRQQDQWCLMIGRTGE